MTDIRVDDGPAVHRERRIPALDRRSSDEHEPPAGDLPDVGIGACLRELVDRWRGRRHDDDDDDEVARSWRRYRINRAATALVGVGAFALAIVGVDLLGQLIAGRML